MIVRHHEGDGCASAARYSDCERYRYDLTRTWEPSGPKALFVMLNPSTATELANDPTIARVERRARRMGFGAYRVCNLFAWRATRPDQLLRAAAPVGPDNDDVLAEACCWADQVICAWGNHGEFGHRGIEVERLLRRTARRLFHLGLTLRGHPKHPLYLPYSAQAAEWRA
ncbi:MAG: DUF1643 domain-containing protein [Gammaproteobacteria bacterium]|nr:DUF1643 domain-containing protein [Gammaproteobacteria bacterium]